MGLFDRRKRTPAPGEASESKPILRVTTDQTSYDDPSEDLLFILCDEDLGHDGAFLVLETVADGHYIQVAGNFVSGSYRIERRAGDSDTHEHAYSKTCGESTKNSQRGRFPRRRSRRSIWSGARATENTADLSDKFR